MIVYTATTKDIVVKATKIILNDSQIKNLKTASITLVPAPGIGKIIVFDKAVWKKPSTLVPYDLTAFDGIDIRYEGTSSTGTVDEGFWLDQDALPQVTSLLELIGAGYVDTEVIFNDKSKIQSHPTYGSVPTYLSFNNNTVIENKALIIHGSFDSTVLTGGDATNTIEVTVTYSIVDI